MKTTRKLYARERAILALVLAVAMVVPALALQADGVHMVQEIAQEDGNAVGLELWAQGERARIDIQQQGQDVSMIMVGGENGSMTMVQHAQRQYLVFDAQRMRQMQQMMNRGGESAASGDATLQGEPPTFTATGNTRQVGEWTAEEYRVEGPDIEGDTRMWFTDDVDVDFFEVMSTVGEVMGSMNNPMMQGAMGGGDTGGVLGRYRRYRAQMQAAGAEFPTGYPVVIETTTDEGTTTMTTKQIELGPFDAATFEPPADYQRVQVPGMGR